MKRAVSPVPAGTISVVGALLIAYAMFGALWASRPLGTVEYVVTLLAGILLVVSGPSLLAREKHRAASEFSEMLAEDRKVSFEYERATPAPEAKRRPSRFRSPAR
ncbi:hypothetical protein JIG36_01245 [Actinoplanes sp. LDG1-06]|uniref:Uncharacterized protein n=1 Tax=Paractinoplanes ovalisporus TaxID=2810368 RepID=A0ABS2A3B5_9ACTN|nr:hypothetical protein [Actinoplanes ovalisporus]MBM2614180.1 hypothetical protein [Actinoplanes ovalisporus]